MAMSTSSIRSAGSFRRRRRSATLVAAVLAEVTADEPGRSDASARPTEDASAVGDRPPGPDAAGEVAVGADHGGYRLKERIAADLRERGVEVHDCGTDSTDAVDYPDFAHGVARLVADGDCRWGIVVDGAGIGSCMAANKVPGHPGRHLLGRVLRAEQPRAQPRERARRWGPGCIGENLALEIVQAWLSTPWGGDRHARRVEKITEIERRYLARAEVGAMR